MDKNKKLTVDEIRENVAKVIEKELPKMADSLRKNIKKEK